MNKETIQALARDIIVSVGKDGYYHGDCARLAVSPMAKAWDEVGAQVKKEGCDTKSRLEIKLEIMRLVRGWNEIHNKKELPPEFQIV